VIRVALSVAWREVRLVAYRAAVLGSIVGRRPYRLLGVDGHTLDAEQCHEIAADTERLARAMIDEEGRR